MDIKIVKRVGFIATILGFALDMFVDWTKDKEHEEDTKKLVRDEIRRYHEKGNSIDSSKKDNAEK